MWESGRQVNTEAGLGIAGRGSCIPAPPGSQGAYESLMVSISQYMVIHLFLISFYDSCRTLVMASFSFSTHGLLHAFITQVRLHVFGK